MKMNAVIWAMLVVGLVAGGATGFSVGKHRGKVEAEADMAAATAQAATVAKAVEGNTAAIALLTEAAQKPVVLDAETRASLASDVPAGCLDPKNSLSAACLTAQCWRFQQGNGGRSDAKTCAELADDARIHAWVQLCAQADNAGPDWDCVAAGIKATREQD
jgi:hypothetical protein